jgi:hypothetical protein
VGDNKRRVTFGLLLLFAAVMMASWAAPASALPGPVGKVTKGPVGKITKALPDGITDALPDLAPDAAPKPVQAARQVVTGAVDHTRNVVSEAARRAREAENAVGNVVNAAADVIVNNEGPLGGAADDPNGAPVQGANEPRGMAAAPGPAPSRRDVEAAEPSLLLTAGNGDAVGGGNDVLPSPGTGAPPADGVCQSSPLCLGILFADDDTAAAGGGGPWLSMPFTGLNPLAGLLAAALLALAGTLLLAPDLLWRRGGGPQPSLAWSAHAAALARSRGSRGF